MNSTSASPEPDALLGIDPDDTYELKVGAATFTVGVLPVGLWDVIYTQYISAMMNNRRRNIALLAKEGLNPEDPDSDSGATHLESRCSADVEFMKDKFRIELEALRLGLKGFTGLKTKRGPLTFETETAEVEGEKRDVVGKKTMDFFKVNKPLVTLVYLALKRLNTLEDEGKKA